MRRFVTPRALVLISATTAIVVAAVVYFARRKPEPVVVREMADEPAPWPPVPVLGRPTEEDFARLRGERVPPRPRKPVPRWAVAGVLIVVVAALGQWFVYAVFDQTAIPKAPAYECEYPECGPEPAGNDYTETEMSWLEPGLVYVEY
ncbi:hypothetical protein [Herbidospora sp. RD11066]